MLNNWHTDHTEDLHILDLASLYFAQRPKDKEYWEDVFTSLKDYVPNQEAAESLIESLKQQRILRELSISAYEVAEGKKPYVQVEKLLEALAKKEEKAQIEETSFVTDDLEILIQNTVQKPGLRWRLDCLNKSLGSLRKGDFGFVFARPETGKTTFLASEVSQMLTQTDKPILWINNEEEGQKVMLRVYQAFFGVTLEQLYGNIGKYRELFKEQSGGRFKLYDSAQTHKRKVEELSKELSPGLIIFDQIDKVQGFEADREDLLLGSIYQWARELAKQYCPVIGVTQSDGSGEGVRWLTMANVANAKTSKQAEADWILGIGAIHDTGWERVRFLNISKNKLYGDADSDPKMRHAKMEAFINAEIAQYEDIK